MAIEQPLEVEAFSILPAWELDADVDTEAAARIVEEFIDAPDADVLLLSSHDGFITVQLLDGTIAGARSVVYMEGRLHDIVRIERWMVGGEGDEPLVVLTLQVRDTA
ncbi:MAG: hypothetical protein ACJ79L_08085 [Anaeromyxobacteraceae bacterium]